MAAQDNKRLTGRALDEIYGGTFGGLRFEIEDEIAEHWGSRDDLGPLGAARAAADRRVGEAEDGPLGDDSVPDLAGDGERAD
jgi:hypothetical protein